jgi:hypothetical protein
VKRSLVLIALLLFAGCRHKRTPISALPPLPPPAVSEEAKPPEPVAPPPEPEPVPVPEVTPPAPEPSAVDQGDAAFGAGHYAEAAKFYEAYIAEKAEPRRDEALFRLAMSYLIPQGASADWGRAVPLLREIVDQYKNSLLRAPAQYLLNMSSDTQKRDQKIKQLTTELDRLKKIDADRRRRP